MLRGRGGGTSSANGKRALFVLSEHHREVRQIHIENARIALAASAEFGHKRALWNDGNRGAPAHVQIVANWLVSAHRRLAPRTVHTL